MVPEQYTLRFSKNISFEKLLLGGTHVVSMDSLRKYSLPFLTSFASSVRPCEVLTIHISDLFAMCHKHFLDIKSNESGKWLCNLSLEQVQKFDTIPCKPITILM